MKFTKVRVKPLRVKPLRVKPLRVKPRETPTFGTITPIFNSKKKFNLKLRVTPQGLNSEELKQV